MAGLGSSTDQADLVIINAKVITVDGDFSIRQAVAIKAGRITVEEAIRTYTINGAWQDNMEGVKGSIEPGKVADFCVIGEDILTVDPHEIGEIPVVMTIVGGKIVFDQLG